MVLSCHLLKINFFGVMMLANQLFVEKYRPVELDDYICDEETKQMIQTFIDEPFGMPHLLCVSSPGTGKTTLAKLIIKNTEADFIYLNASDERGINMVRDKIKEFASTRGFNSNAPKIVHLDEADGLTNDAQNVLRNIMEEYSSNCRFILTANNYNKIIEPIRSRCKEIVFVNPPKDVIVKRIANIRSAESIDISDEIVNKIVEAYYPDIRSMVKTLDSYKKFGVLDLETQNDITNQIYELVKQKKVTKAREVWISKKIRYDSMLKMLYAKVWDDETIDKVKKKNIIYAIADSDFAMTMGAEPEIQFASCIFKIVEIL